VVIPLLTQHYAMLQRNLVYTGLTRGKQLVVLVGQKKALAMAVKNHLGRRRYTKLAEWLAPADAIGAPVGKGGSREAPTHGPLIGPGRRDGKVDRPTAPAVG
jgi:hypothetical protein